MHQLHCHPSAAAPAVDGVSVSLDWAADGRLLLRYLLLGRPEALRLPAVEAHPGRRDNLWQHTCCEAFVAGGPGTAYREFNFSPSGHWASYDFADYRTPAGAAPQGTGDAGPAPVIATIPGVAGLEIAVALPPELLPPAEAEWMLGLSVVVEAADGSKSYWALAHPGPPPDFHDRAAFVARLAAPIL